MRAPARVLLRLGGGSASLLGVGLYLASWWRGTNEWPAPLAVQSLWRSEASTPWASFARGIDHAVRFGGWWLVDAVFVVGVLAVIVAGARRLRPAYTVFGLSSLVLPLLAIFPPRPFLSMPRFCAVLFPVSLVLARQRFLPDALVTAVLAASWVVLAVAFVNWQYIF